MFGEVQMDDIILISGGFDPVHSGHINLIIDAGSYGDVVVLLNSDHWLKNKKGKEFLPFYERKTIMLALKKVIDVIEFDDSNQTCVEGIKKALKKYNNRIIKFANGGDRNTNSTPTPEFEFCTKYNIEMLWGIGGTNKSNSSSWILKKWNEKN